MKKSGYSCFEPKYRSFNPLTHMCRWGRNIERAYQRIRYGYCEMDVWSIDSWFLNVFPNMLEELKETTHGYPVLNLDNIKDDGMGMDTWKNILSEMIFLFREANEDTCTRINQYEEGYQKALDEFSEKYGMFGERLKSEEEKNKEKKTGGRRIYSLHDVQEYKEISDRYFEEFKEICNYRDECKNKGLSMLKEHFWELWD